MAITNLYTIIIQNILRTPDTELGWPQIHIAIIHLYTISIQYTVCTLDTHCNDNPRYTLLLPIFILLLFTILYLIYPGYTLLSWLQIHIAITHIYTIIIHYILRTLDTHFDGWAQIHIAITNLYSIII